MKEPKNKVFQIGDEPNDEENNHIHIPIKLKCQHDVGMIERFGFNFQLILEISLTIHVKTIIHRAIYHSFLSFRYLIVLKKKFNF